MRLENGLIISTNSKLISGTNAFIFFAIAGSFSVTCVASVRSSICSFISAGACAHVGPLHESPLQIHPAQYILRLVLGELFPLWRLLTLLFLKKGAIRGLGCLLVIVRTPLLKGILLNF